MWSINVSVTILSCGPNPNYLWCMHVWVTSGHRCHSAFSPAIIPFRTFSLNGIVCTPFMFFYHCIMWKMSVSPSVSFPDHELLDGEDRFTLCLQPWFPCWDTADVTMLVTWNLDNSPLSCLPWLYPLRGKKKGNIFHNWTWRVFSGEDLVVNSFPPHFLNFTIWTTVNRTKFHILTELLQIYFRFIHWWLNTCVFCHWARSVLLNCIFEQSSVICSIKHAFKI